MKKPRSPVWRWLLAVLGPLLVATIYALTPYAIPEVSRTLPPLSEIRALALSSGLPLPVEVRALQVADNVTSRFIVIAGPSFREQPMVSYTFQPVYADGRTLLIDAVADEEVMRSVFANSRVFPEAYARMQEAMRQAEHIVVTHEHFDHSSGISRSPHLAELAGRVAMTDAQLQGAMAEWARFTPDIVRHLEPLRYERLHLLAPGVVLVKAPGHTPGSQLVYVHLDDGRELLFVGDIAWNMDNILLPRGHSRWVSWALSEDGPVMADQLRYLHDMMVREPNVHLVVAHDGARLSDSLRQGLLVEGLR